MLATSVKKSLVLSLFLLCFTSTSFAKTQVYFSPDDKPLRALTTLLRTAEKRIFVAMYQFSAKPLAQLLIAAHKRNVRVEIIVDQATTELPNNCLGILKDAGIPVFIHAPKNKTLNHHKFAVVDGCVWTGSMNWTYRGLSHNQENSLLCDESGVTARYAKQFDVLKHRCERVIPQETAPTTGLLERLRKNIAQLLGALE